MAKNAIPIYINYLLEIERKLLNRKPVLLTDKKAYLYARENLNLYYERMIDDLEREINLLEMMLVSIKKPIEIEHTLTVLNKKKQELEETKEINVEPFLQTYNSFAIKQAKIRSLPLKEIGLLENII